MLGGTPAAGAPGGGSAGGPVGAGVPRGVPAPAGGGGGGAPAAGGAAPAAGGQQGPPPHPMHGGMPGGMGWGGDLGVNEGVLSCCVWRSGKAAAPAGGGC